MSAFRNAWFDVTVVAKSKTVFRKSALTVGAVSRRCDIYKTAPLQVTLRTGSKDIDIAWHWFYSLCASGALLWPRRCVFLLSILTLNSTMLRNVCPMCEHACVGPCVYIHMT